MQPEISSITHYRAMASYNRWMNQGLVAACTDLSNTQLNADRGAFFGSIMGTFNHLWVTDQMWLARFSGQPLLALALDAIPFSEMTVFTEERAALDLAIISWVETLTSEWLAADFSFVSVADGQTHTRPAWLFVSHWFNHQTHHRGQITTLLSQAGIDPGVTDLARMP